MEVTFQPPSQPESNVISEAANDMCATINIRTGSEEFGGHHTASLDKFLGFMNHRISLNGMIPLRQGVSVVLQ